MSESPKRNYGLDWIDNEKLFEVTKKCFSKVYRNASKPLDVRNSKNSIDPFTAVFQVGATPDLDYEAWVLSEKTRQSVKTLQNSVGAWHQSVLGLAPGWENKGSSGGVYDIETTELQKGFGLNPEDPKHVIAEVKNKFNTIKASDENKTHKSLHDQASSRTNTVAYLIQIIPKNKSQYNKIWVPSQSFNSNKVFVIDGATAYDLIFKRENALRDIYQVLPAIIQDVRESLGISDGKRSTMQLSEDDWIKFQDIFRRTFG